MPVLGIDFGTENLLVGVARQRGVDILVNEASNRMTPACVTFDDLQRFIGEQAASRKNSKVLNTFFGVKQLIGRYFSDPVVQEEAKHLPFKLTATPEGSVGLCVKYRGEDRVFSAEQVTAMLLTSLRDIATADAIHKQAAVPKRWDTVITIPGWWDQTQRQAMLAAIDVADLNCLQLLSEHAAAGVTWLRRKLPELTDKPTRMLLFDMGHSATTVALMSLTNVDGKATLQVDGVAYDTGLGGRDYDRLLAEHFAAKFQEKHRVDLHTSPKAMGRLLQGVQKARKQLTANTDAPLNIECLINDLDMHFKMSRDDMAELCSHLTSRIPAVVQRALDAAKIADIAVIDAFEVIGGAARMPAILDGLASALGLPDRQSLHQTLNNEEAICNGAALQGAFLSPHFKMSQTVAVKEYTPYDISVVWAKAGAAPEIEQTSDAAATSPLLEHLTAFPQGGPTDLTRAVSFKRKAGFDVHLHYSDAESLPTANKATWLASATVSGVQPTSDGHNSKVKVQVRLDGSGVAEIVEASMDVIETYTEVVKTPVEEPEEAEVDMEGKKEKAEEETDKEEVKPEEVKPEEKKPEKKEKKEPRFTEESVTKTRRVTRALPVTRSVRQTAPETVTRYIKEEAALAAIDRQQTELLNTRNDLESYVYNMQDDLSMKYSEVTTEDERAAFVGQLRAVEDWLYTDEGEEAGLKELGARMTELKAVGDKIVERYDVLHAPPPEPEGEKEAGEEDVDMGAGPEKEADKEEADVDME